MYLIVGLGNPGAKYEKTRHNVGFRVLDLLATDVWENKYDSQLIKLDDLVLAKPQTFMNKSGEAVAQILKYYPAPVGSHLIVVHDELDLPLGSLKIQKNLSGAGHNGVQSIIDEIGTKDFIRVRIGVNNPELRGQLPGEDYVLKNFEEQEQDLVNEVLEKAKAAVESIQTDGLEIAQSKYNG
jgi:peptidyl-tRNA hydrolase, PTH1 family